MEWWYYGPIVLAVVMFLLVGTICERRIESAVRQIIARRQALLESRQTEVQDVSSSITNLERPCRNCKSASTLYRTKSTSQRNLKPCKTDASLVSNERRLETLSIKLKSKTE